MITSSGSSKTVCYRVCTTCTRIAASESTPLIVGQSAPDSVIFAGLHSPAQTALHDLTAMAHDLGLFDLAKGGAGVPDGEEQLGVLI
jgi:hypothetical protein